MNVRADSPEFQRPGRGASVEERSEWRPARLDRAGQARLWILADFTPRGDRSLDLFFAGFARAMAGRGWAVNLTFAGLGPESYRAELLRAGVGVAQLPFPFGTRSAVELARRLFRNRTAVLQTHFIGSFQAWLLALKPMGAVRKLQIVDHLSGDLKRLRGPLQTLRRMRGMAAGALVDEYVAVSRFVAGRIVRAGVPSRRVRIIENGIPVERFTPVESRTPGELPTVVFAGQLILEKGLQVLLEAAKGMPAAAHWVIAGVGRQQGELEVLAQSLNVPARFAGQVDSAELFAGPTSWSFRASGTRPSAWSLPRRWRRVPRWWSPTRGGLPEVVGEAGVVVPRGDAVALRSELERLHSLAGGARPPRRRGASSGRGALHAPADDCRARGSGRGAAPGRENGADRVTAVRAELAARFRVRPRRGSSGRDSCGPGRRRPSAARRARWSE